LDPLAVPVEVIDEIKQRGADGVIRLQPETFNPGERVRVVEGRLRGFEAIFERYLSGAERVALLLATVEANGVRVILSASSVSKRL
jgi:transcription antitermination factor NusG